MSNTLGTRIRELRHQKKLSQKEFGKLFTLAESTIGMYERDERKPDYEILEKIADHFGVSINYMFGRPDKIEPIVTDEDKEFESWLSDPADERFFEEYHQAPEERRAALRDMWEILKKQGKE